ncbi:hypothetical protein FDP22_12480 [Paroceanicella profunda]|uniref:Uncharacterized protein n=1 Tax=Paroceanicella profunda TaxID=2579971 RepID=A0A5B8FY44_9RHOB|nr:hypothetical protein [Paroceanicella profunda]QDL92524.1 hypothetical protein FDP22_12480 [Paroceanicella profunda]
MIHDNHTTLPPRPRPARAIALRMVARGPFRVAPTLVDAETGQPLAGVERVEITDTTWSAYSVRATFALHPDIPPTPTPSRRPVTLDMQEVRGKRALMVVDRETRQPLKAQSDLVVKQHAGIGAIDKVVVTLFVAEEAVPGAECAEAVERLRAQIEENERATKVSLRVGTILSLVIVLIAGLACGLAALGAGS